MMKQSILTIYFSGTGNSAYIARLFSRNMGAQCHSIEDGVDFDALIKAHGTIAFCYPVYGSRVPRILREFTARHMFSLVGKKLIIFATQASFSGDGARAFTYMFPAGSVKVIYAEHFNLPNNISNTPFTKPPNKQKIRRYIQNAKLKMNRACNEIRRGIVRKRGFSVGSGWLGFIQGLLWQGRNNRISPSRYSVESFAKNKVTIHGHCTACNLCVKVCPMKNLANRNGVIEQLNNCTICYRCVNRCPQKAISVMIPFAPKWQYWAGDK